MCRRLVVWKAVRDERHPINECLAVQCTPNACEKRTALAVQNFCLLGLLSTDGLLYMTRDRQNMCLLSPLLVLKDNAGFFADYCRAVKQVKSG